MTSTARLWHLLRATVKPKIMSCRPCICFAALSRNALENLVLLAWRRAQLAVGIAAAVVLFGLHLLY